MKKCNFFYLQVIYIDSVLDCQIYVCTFLLALVVESLNLAVCILLAKSIFPLICKTGRSIKTESCTLFFFSSKPQILTILNRFSRKKMQFYIQLGYFCETRLITLVMHKLHVQAFIQRKFFFKFLIVLTLLDPLNNK